MSSQAEVAEQTLLTLEELAERVGMSVRNIRYYTSKGLVPPPLRRGRMAYYSAAHLARLQVVLDLQEHGFTLAAIEGYLARIPSDASPETVALHRIMLAPWQVEEPRRMTLGELSREAGRPVDERTLASLTFLEVVRPDGEDRYVVSVGRLAGALRLVDLHVPLDVIKAPQDLILAHGRALAAELGEMLRSQLWPAYQGGGLSTEQMLQIIETFKPLSIAVLVEAYSQAITEARRAEVERRSS